MPAKEFPSHILPPQCCKETKHRPVDCSVLDDGIRAEPAHASQHGFKSLRILY